MIPPWFNRGLRELGVEEWPGAEHNPRIVEYLNYTPVGRWAPYDETAWCGAFQAFSLAPYADLPEGAHRARGWLAWGEPCGEQLGATCVIKRRRSGPDRRTGSRGGYHVGQWVNRSRGGFVLLSGNAQNRVGVDWYSLRRYDVLGYRMPEGYER